jgi:hypothetical protein
MLRKIGKITRVKGFDDLGSVFNDPDAGAAHFTLEIPHAALQQLNTLPRSLAQTLQRHGSDVIEASERSLEIAASFGHIAAHLKSVRDRLQEATKGIAAKWNGRYGVQTPFAKSLHTGWHFDAFGDPFEPDWGAHLHLKGENEGMIAVSPQNGGAMIDVVRDDVHTSRRVTDETLRAALADPAKGLTMVRLKVGDVLVFNRNLLHGSFQESPEDTEKFRAVIK